MSWELILKPIFWILKMLKSTRNKIKQDIEKEFKPEIENLKIEIERLKVQDSRIKLDVNRNLPPPKLFSSSQDLIDRWGIDWKKLATIINNNCLSIYYHSGIPGDYQLANSIDYESNYHNDKPQKDTILSFYFKDSDVKRLEGILQNIKI